MQWTRTQKHIKKNTVLFTHPKSDIYIIPIALKSVKFFYLSRDVINKKKIIYQINWCKSYIWKWNVLIVFYQNKIKDLFCHKVHIGIQRICNL